MWQFYMTEDYPVPKQLKTSCFVIKLSGKVANKKFERDMKVLLGPLSLIVKIHCK